MRQIKGNIDNSNNKNHWVISQSKFALHSPDK